MLRAADDRHIIALSVHFPNPHSTTTAEQRFFGFVSLQFRFVLLGFVLIAYAGLCLWRFVCLRFSTLSFVDSAAAAVADVAGDNSDYLNTCYMHVRYQSEIERETGSGGEHRRQRLLSSFLAQVIFVKGRANELKTKLGAHSTINRCKNIGVKACLSAQYSAVQLNMYRVLKNG